jgi:DNA recombination protein RmuC
LIAFLLLALVAGVLAVIFLLLRKKEDISGEKIAAMMERLSGLSEQNQELRRSLDEKLSETHRATQEQYRMAQEQIGQTIQTVHGISGQSAKLIQHVTEKLTKLDETNKQIVNFSSQLQSLQDILKNPSNEGSWESITWKRP